MSDGIDLDTEFKAYLDRFDERVGDAEFGAFVKHEGKLVKKLRREEFDELYSEYFELAKRYFDSMDRGDTINDVVVRILRQRAAELFLTSPA